MLAGDPRKQIELVYREYRAILILSGSLTAAERRNFDYTLASLPILPQSELRRFAEVPERLRDLRQRLGATKNLDYYEWLLGQGLPGKLLFIRKHIVQEDFRHYERMTPIFAQLPIHAQIGVDVHGILGNEKPETSWSLLEAKLLEDVALLWNDTLDAELRAKANDSKLATKRKTALLRATSRATFHLLEGYLNGIAFDASKLLDLDEKTLEFLLERRKPVSFRDKFLQYVKIAAQLKHPPLQETNCPEMKLVLDQVERLRHSLVHPTPRVDEDEEGPFRETVFFDMTTNEAPPQTDETCRQHEAEE